MIYLLINLKREVISYIIQYYLIPHMEEIKTMYYITKTLEEAFTKITYGAAKYMMNIPKYKAELKNDLKRINASMEKDKKREKMKEKLKEKEESKKKRETQIREQEIWRREKLRQKEIQKNFQQPQPSESRPIPQSQPQPVLHSQPQFPIYSQPKSHTVKSLSLNSSKSQSIKDRNECPLRWSYLAPKDELGGKPQCYKIAKVNQITSDFENPNNLKKVPEIRPRQPLTPFFLFLRANRYDMEPQVRNLQKPKQLEILKNVWLKLKKQQKQLYENEYTRSKKLYRKKLTEYYEAHPQVNRIEEKTEKQDEKSVRKTKSKKKEEKRSLKSKKNPKKDYAAKSIFQNMNDLQI